ncbi:MAG: LysE family translocator [Deinococcota bacterium]
MALTTLLFFAITELTLSLSPGPAVFLVVSQGIKSGFKSSLRGTLGVMTGELIFFSLSAAGLSAVITTSQVLFSAIKWLGAAYLVYLGIKMVVASFQKLETTQPRVPVVQFYRQGLLTQLANPKAILFFTALLPQFIDPSLPATQQFVLLGVVSMIVQSSTLIVYGWLAEKGGRLLRESPLTRWLDRVAGGFLVAAGVKLALTQQTD